ncbi:MULTISPECIES: MFS transporter [unclassified Streptomyces]|uniref:MFS transporter n=1 Tax=unclassified Streptomyces TaxID=2593676 RepID=UPI000F6CEF8D|nr:MULTISPECIES: MFS transporter [unclassified Streptomyces]AZM63486.1 MFS transporter [Streptomyces sp. WAC 01438]RSM95967.1 MFS transporter [Streptomyces sp. WAC 01420]
MTMTSQSRRAGVAALVGTALEWYDFLIYGTAAALVLNKLFFPAESPLVSTLAAFATYAVGFLARPLGGLFLGALGDRLGRKAVLVLTLLVMGSATALIGVLPTYDQIGIAAPVLLILLRLVQGFGAGGEYAGAVVLSVEHADQQRRGAAGAWAPVGYATATLLAAGVFQLFLLMPDDQFRAWGWRVPFLLSLVVVAVGYLIRRQISETPAFEKAQEPETPQRLDLFAALRKEPRSFLVVIGARFAENGFAYLFPVFGVAFVTTELGVSGNVALGAVVAAAALEMITIPVYARLSDRIGRRPVYVAGAIASVVWVIPFFLLVGTGSTWAVMLAFIVGLGVAYPAMLAPQAAWFAELFGTRTRLSGFAFAREIGSVLAGGLAPFVATALFAWAGHWWPVAVYMALMTAITLAALAVGPETLNRDIETPVSGETPGVGGQQGAVPEAHAPVGSTDR